MRRGESRRIALCGVMGALAVVVMLMGSVIPVATFCAPLISSVLMLVVAIEHGMKTAMLLYLAVSLLALILVPDREMAMVFVFCLGYYPMLKAYLEKLHPALVRWAAKLAVFNGSIMAMYAVLLYIFPMQALVDEFKETGKGFVVVLLAMGNLAFVIYDRALEVLAQLYMVKLRPMLSHRI